MANDTPSGSTPKGSGRATAKATKPRAKAAATRTRSSGAATRSRGASAKGAATHTAAARRSRGTASRSTVELVGDYAERAVLIPVGVALAARDSVVSGVSDVLATYSSPSKTQTQLRKFERRGSTARNRLEREVRKTRTRLEREVRERRRELERRRAGLTHDITSQVEQTQAQLERQQAKVEGALRARLEDGADFANRVQERVLSLV
ncbi:MAG TPA: hypothetical protein VMU32_11635 [Solirubrobacteraceae bacterium]|nr:hypothetical protein [Solirubrobacteraceae bacterium]